MRRNRTVHLAALALLLAAVHGAAGESCVPFVEEHPRWHSVSVRVHSDAFTECRLDEEGYARLLDDWAAARAVRLPVPDSMALGRAVHYPWVGEALARAALDDERWDATRGAPRRGHANAVVADLLSTPVMLERLGRPLRAHGLRIRGVSVEKVLVDDARTVLGAGAPAGLRLPFDAQIWLLLAAAP